MGYRRAYAAPHHGWPFAYGPLILHIALAGQSLVTICAIISTMYGAPIIASLWISKLNVALQARPPDLKVPGVSLGG